MGFFIQIWLLTNSDSGRREDPGLGFQYCQCALVPLTAIADINNLSHSGYIISQYRDVTFYCCFTSYLHIQTNDFSIELTLNGWTFNMENERRVKKLRVNAVQMIRVVAPQLPCPQSSKCWILV